MTEENNLIKNLIYGTCPVVQWLRLCTSTAGVQVRSLVRELRSHIHSVARKNVYVFI